MSGNRLFKGLIWVVVVGLLLLLPKILPLTDVILVIDIVIFSLFAVSFNLLVGYTGLLPFGYAAMFGVGAYACALMLNHAPNVHLFLTLFTAGLAAFVAAVVIGFFSVRLSGTYFALITLAFQMFLFAVATKWRAVTNGDDGMGIVRPDFWVPGFGKVSIAGLEIAHLYYLTLTFCGLGILIMYLFLKTPLGNAVMCMKENDQRASFLGYDAFLTKLTIFSFAGFFAGVAGAFYVLFNEFVATTAIDASMSFDIVIMAIIGGTGNFLGPVVGVAFYKVFQNWISSVTTSWWLFLGIVFVLVVMFFEGGLVSLFDWKKIRLALRREET